MTHAFLQVSLHCRNAENIIPELCHKLWMEFDAGHEFLIGAGRNRHWPYELTRHLVTKTLLPLVPMNKVTQPVGMQPNHLLEWRRMAHEGKLVSRNLLGATFVPTPKTFKNRHYLRGPCDHSLQHFSNLDDNIVALSVRNSL